MRGCSDGPNATTQSIIARSPKSIITPDAVKTSSETMQSQLEVASGSEKASTYPSKLKSLLEVEHVAMVAEEALPSLDSIVQLCHGHEATAAAMWAKRVVHTRCPHPRLFPLSGPNRFGRDGNSR